MNPACRSIMSNSTVQIHSNELLPGRPFHKGPLNVSGEHTTPGDHEKPGAPQRGLTLVTTQMPAGPDRTGWASSTMTLCPVATRVTR